MSEKSVCFVNSNKAWGGGEKWHFTTCQYLKSKGYTTFLVVNLNSAIFRKANQARLYTYGVRISNLSFLNPIKILLLATLFRSRKVGTVVMNLPADLKVAGIAAKIAGVKNIVYRRGMPHPLRSTILNRFLFNKILTHVIVNSEEIGRSLASANKEWFPVKKMVLVYNGVDTSIPMIPKSPIYQKQEGELVIGNAGRLVDQKGQVYLLEVVRKLKDEGMNIKLLIAGEGELRDALTHKINELNILDSVKLIGHVEDMNAFMNSLDVFVFSSKFEGSANTLIETLYFQKPIVAFDVSSNPEIVIDGQTGLLAKAFDVGDFASKVKTLLGDQEMQKKFIANGTELLAQRFDSNRNLEIVERIINS